MESVAVPTQATRNRLMICLDTHTLLWWTLEPRRLSAVAARAIGSADGLGIPTIVFWEVALLTRKGKLKLGTTASEWTREVLSIPRVEPLPLTAEIAVAAESLDMHPDPADRFIVATAIQHDLTLVSKDRLIRQAALATVLW